MILPAGWIWMALPGIVALLLLAWPRSTRGRAYIATVLVLALALAALFLPIDKVLILLPGRFFLHIRPSWTLLNRVLVLTDAFRPWLAGLYLALALWLWAAPWARMHPSFVGLALGIGVLLLMALTVRPFLYAALVVEIAVLATVPLASPGEEPTGEGVVRYMAWMTLALPFLLLSGVYLTGLETAPADSPLVRRALPFLVGALLPWLGILPFHSAAPALAESTHPYRAAFILTMMTSTIAVFGLSMVERFTWLRTSETTYLALRLAGMAMFLLGSLWAPFQRHAGRSLGYAWLAENGLGLMALGLGGAQGLEAFTLLLPARMVLFWAMALALAVLIAPEGHLHRDALWGRGRARPWAAGLWVLTWLGLAAWPWTVGVWPRWNVAQGLARLGPLWLLLYAAGLLALSGTALRWWRILWGEREEEEQAPEPPQETRWDRKGLLWAYLVLAASLMAPGAVWSWSQWAARFFALFYR